MPTNKLGGPLSDRHTLADRAFDRIREAIVAGRLAPGESLSEVAFANALEISRTSLREALSKLEAQGYAVRDQSNRWRIFSMTEQSARDIYECRGVLQGFAARQAIAHLTAQELDKMRSLLSSERDAYSRGEFDRVIESSTAFHEHIISAAHNAKLEFLLQILRPQLLINRRLMLSHTSHGEHMLVRNEKLMSAIVDGDADAAESVARDNAQFDLETVLELFQRGLLSGSSLEARMDTLADL